MIHVISLGRSIGFGERIDYWFLKKFVGIVKRSKDEFHIVVGGGKLARDYQRAGKNLSMNDIELDLVGIAATKINAEFIRNMIKAKEVITNPEKPGKQRINIYAGWKPGFSTDYVSVVVAKKLGVKKVINITRVGYLFDKNPAKEGAKRIKSISKKEMMRRFRNKWSPGLKFPFDPKAVRESKDIDIVIIGKSTDNIKKVLKGKEFKGTLIYS